MLGFFALSSALVLGWLGFSLWWAIPIGALAFWAGLRELPGKSKQIGAMGVPTYMLTVLVLMVLSRWAHGLFA